MDIKQEILKELREKFVLDPAEVFFGNRDELRKQGWEVGKSKLIIKQSATPEQLEAFLSDVIDRVRKEQKLDSEYSFYLGMRNMITKYSSDGTCIEPSPEKGLTIKQYIDKYIQPKIDSIPDYVKEVTET